MKGYHNRMYFYSSGTILSQATRKLKRWMKKIDDPDTDDDLTDSDEEVVDKGDDSDYEEEDEAAAEHLFESDEEEPVVERPANMSSEDMLRKASLYMHHISRIQTVYICAFTYTTRLTSIHAVYIWTKPTIYKQFIYVH